MNNFSPRTGLLVKNIAASFFIKGWSAIVVLIMVPLTLKMLGVYTNGVWLTISGILMWIDFMDIGLGNGLRNAVAKYIATGDTGKVQVAVSSTIFMLIIIIIPVIFILSGIVQFFDIYGMLGVEKDHVQNLDDILVVAITFSCVTFILKSVGNLYMGLQLPAVNNLILCLGQTLALILTFSAYLMGYCSLMTIVVINTLAPLTVWLLSIPYTFYYRYPQFRPTIRAINLRMSLTLCYNGIQFFILQICSIILFASVNILISRMFSPAEVTPYQIAYRYFSIILTLFNIISMPFWNATTDAYTRGDINWIRKSSRKLNMVIGCIFITLVLMVVISPVCYRLWVGDDVVIPIELSISTALYVFVLMVSLRYSYMLNGVNALRIQLIFTIGSTVVFLPLAWFVCSRFNTVTSLVLTMCFINLPGLVANAWKYYKIFYKK